MYRLISNRIVVQTLHDIDLSGPRPLPLSLVTRFEPNSGQAPCAPCNLAFTSDGRHEILVYSWYIHPVIYGAVSFSRSVFTILSIPSYHLASHNRPHCPTYVEPFRIGPRNFRPCCRVERSTIEVIFPHQLPSRRISEETHEISRLKIKRTTSIQILFS